MGQPDDEELRTLRKERGAKIRNIRQERGLKKSQLAASCESSYSHIDNIEHGRKQPSIELLYRIARELAVPINEIQLDVSALERSA